VLLWDWDEGQCDWYVSGADLNVVARFVATVPGAPIEDFYSHGMPDEELRKVLRAGGAAASS
jgi:hypothetical protein